MNGKTIWLLVITTSVLLGMAAGPSQANCKCSCSASNTNCNCLVPWQCSGATSCNCGKSGCPSTTDCKKCTHAKSYPCGGPKAAGRYCPKNGCSAFNCSSSLCPGGKNTCSKKHCTGSRECGCSNCCPSGTCNADNIHSSCYEKAEESVACQTQAHTCMISQCDSATIEGNRCYTESSAHYCCTQCSTNDCLCANCTADPQEDPEGYCCLKCTTR